MDGTDGGNRFKFGFVGAVAQAGIGGIPVQLQPAELDGNQALAFGDKFFFMKDGVVKYAGGKEIVTEEVIRDIYDIQVRFETIDGKKVMLPVA